MDAADVTPAFRAEFGLPIASCKQAGLTTLALSSANWLFSALPGKCARSRFPSFDGRTASWPELQWRRGTRRECADSRTRALNKI
jgi:hypothetical protein